MWIDREPRVKNGQVITHLGPGFPRGKWVWDSFNPDPGGQPFEGFQWRTVPELKINYVWLYLYITTSQPRHVSKVWFDDVVVATEYIGPIAAMKPTK
jgi:hypothetical protein